MPGSHSRRKGADGERELAHILDAEKISSMYRPGADLAWRGTFIEVKRRRSNDGFSLPDRLLDDTPIVACRRDRGDWVMSMRPDTLLDLLDEAREEGVISEEPDQQ